MYELLSEYGFDFHYNGFDVSEKMIQSAERRIGTNKANCSLYVGSNLMIISDYTVASGIFNVRQQTGNEIWMKYILHTLDDMNSHSARGFSFNCLTNYVDKDYVKDYLFYSDPQFLFNYCKMNYSRNVALLHDYNLYDFTILVRKECEN